MSDNKNIPNEDELWSVLSEPVSSQSAPKSEPKNEEKPAAAEAPKAEPKAEPVREKAPAASGKRKLDGFFFACMAGVAAVSVAATLLISSMVGGNDTPTPGVQDPISTQGSGAADEMLDKAPDALSQLEQENADLRSQVEIQKKQLLDLQAQLIELQGAEGQLPTDPEGNSELMNEQLEAYEIFDQIKAAYADFDRETLEKLIPEMDQRLEYLSRDSRNEYYLILEYVEQPSNG